MSMVPKTAREGDIKMKRTEEAEKFGQMVGYALSQALMDYYRDRLPEMEPEERRLFCKDVETSAAQFYGNRTGKFFNEMAGCTTPQKEDEKELGRRIMAKRNTNYRVTDPGEERRDI